MCVCVYKLFILYWGGGGGGVALIINKRVQNCTYTVLGCNVKNDRMLSVHFQGKPFNITVIQVYASTTEAKEAYQFYEDLEDLLKHRKKMFYSSLEIGMQKYKVKIYLE